MMARSINTTLIHLKELVLEIRTISSSISETLTYDNNNGNNKKTKRNNTRLNQGIHVKFCQFFLNSSSPLSTPVSVLRAATPITAVVVTAT